MIKNQKGQSLVEYLIIVAVVAVGSVGIMRVVGQSVNAKFAQIAQGLGAKVEGRIEAAEVKQSYLKKKSLKNFLQGAGTNKSNASNESEEE